MQPPVREPDPNYESVVMLSAHILMAKYEVNKDIAQQDVPEYLFPSRAGPERVIAAKARDGTYYILAKALDYLNADGL